MNFFESELRKMIGAEYPDATFVGRACYVSLSDMNRAKIVFTTCGIADEYPALQMMILNRNDGQIDSSELYRVLHDDLELSDNDITLLGFDLPQCYANGRNTTAANTKNIGGEGRCKPLSFEEAKEDIVYYLSNQEDTYFAERGKTKEGVLQNKDLIGILAAEHMKCVNNFGNERDWSCRDACDVDPGIGIAEENENRPSLAAQLQTSSIRVAATQANSHMKTRDTR